MKSFGRWVVLALMIGLGVACNDSTDNAAEPDGDSETDTPAADGDADSDAEASAITQPPVACGMAEYVWQPTENVGIPMEWEPLDLWTMNKDAFANMMRAAGLESPIPLKYDFATYRYRYVTQDRGQLVEATGTLAVPVTTDLEQLPTVLNIHGTTGWSDPCAPTANLLDQSHALAGFLAAMGYITVSPDHIGMAGFGDASTVPHAYIAGEPIALGSWDALRAGLRLLSDDLEAVVEPDGRVVLFGASQGGHGALFTELFGPYYAPEFDVRAVVADVPVASLHYATRFSGADDSLSVPGILAITLMSQSLWYGQGDLADLLTDSEPHFFAQDFADGIYATDDCPLGDYPPVDATTFDNLFAPDFLAAVDAGSAPEPWACFLDENSLDTTRIEPLRHTPTLMTFGELDPLVPPAEMDGVFDALCTAGYQLEYRQCKGAGHMDAALWSIAEQYSWIEARLAGDPIEAERLCTRRPAECCLGSPAEICE